MCNGGCAQCAGGRASSTLGRHLLQLVRNLLVDARHPDEPRWLRLDQSFNEGALQSILVREPDGGPAEHGEVDVDHLGGHVAEREVGHADLLVVVPVENVLTGLNDPGYVVLGQENTFRLILTRKMTLLPCRLWLLYLWYPRCTPPCRLGSQLAGQVSPEGIDPAVLCPPGEVGSS